MKNSAPLFMAIACMFIFVVAFGQRNDSIVGNLRMGNMQIVDAISGDDRVVVSYHVEERINMNFRSQITTYRVSDLSLVGKNDLGPNNTRIVTPIYGKARMKPRMDNIAISARSAAVTIDRPAASADIKMPAIMPKTEKAPAYVNIDIIGTYERVLEKGYQSVDMLKRVGNSRYFDGDLVTAAKWYSKLFELTTDLEASYYYRYAQSLKSISQVDKANEMMAIFEKSL
jgi:hypothetical protein